MLVAGIMALAIRHRAKGFRRSGDSARAAGLWREAARAYQDYLSLRPYDFAIWVQLGHALKEASDLVEADRAYARARELRANDPDLLVHGGHLRKLLGDFRGATADYARSLELGQYAVRTELLAPALAPHLSLKTSALLMRSDGALLDGLARYCSRVRPILAHGIVLTPDGALHVDDDDPWIECTLNISADERAAELCITQPDASPQYGRPGSALHLIDGSAFDTRDILSFRAASDGQISVLLGLPARISRFRWHPAGTASPLKFFLHFDTLRHAELLHKIGRASEDPSDRALALAAAERLSEGDAELDPITVTRDLSVSVLDHGFDYSYWRQRHERFEPDDPDSIAGYVAALPRRPRFSFLLPVFDPPADLLRACIESLRGQIYPKFEICIVDDASRNPAINSILLEYVAADPRISLTTHAANLHISTASNTALAQATGDFVVLVDHDDVLPCHALATIAHYTNMHPSSKVLFSDEDKIDVNGVRSSPYFKGGYNHYLMLGQNMVSHLGIYDRELLIEIGGFRVGVEGSQDYDLFLRCVERCGEDAVFHVPHVLYHWRAISGSTALSADQKGYAATAALRAINEHLRRTERPLEARASATAGLYDVAPIARFDGSLSIILRAPPQNVEPIDLPAWLLDELRPEDDLLILGGGAESAPVSTADRSVTYIHVSTAETIGLAWNEAARTAQGDTLLFLDGSVRALQPGWRSRAAGWAAIEEIGVVGGRIATETGPLWQFGLTLGDGPEDIVAPAHAGLPHDQPGYFGKGSVTQEFSAIGVECLLIRKAVFTNLGGFDPGLTAFQDVDLCLRATLAGLKIVGDGGFSVTIDAAAAEHTRPTAASRGAAASLLHQRWGSALGGDRFVSPNLALRRSDFALAYPPRVTLPWRAIERPS